MNFSPFFVWPARWSAALALALLPALPAQAQITCDTVSMSDLNFGNVDPLASQTDATATLSYSCSNTTLVRTYNVRLCFNLGAPSGSGTNPREMASGANKLQFQLYRDAGRSQIWGSSYLSAIPVPQEVTFSLGPGASTSGSRVLYGRVSGGQNTVPPGNYESEYTLGDTALVIKRVLVTWPFDPPPPACDNSNASERFPFTVRANVMKKCQVTATTTEINLGTVAASATNIPGTGGISVACSNGTAYTVGLRPSNGSATGAGVMAAGGGNPDQVPYQLYQNAARTIVWGDTAATGIGGTGNGAARALPVYVRAPSADFRPGVYEDTVTVIVSY